MDSNSRMKVGVRILVVCVVATSVGLALCVALTKNKSVVTNSNKRSSDELTLEEATRFDMIFGAYCESAGLGLCYSGKIALQGSRAERIFLSRVSNTEWTVSSEIDCRFSKDDDGQSAEWFRVRVATSAEPEGFVDSKPEAVAAAEIDQQMVFLHVYSGSVSAGDNFSAVGGTVEQFVARFESYVGLFESWERSLSSSVSVESLVDRTLDMPTWHQVKE